MNGRTQPEVCEVIQFLADHRAKLDETERRRTDPDCDRRQPAGRSRGGSSYQAHYRARRNAENPLEALNTRMKHESVETAARVRDLALGAAALVRRSRGCSATPSASQQRAKPSGMPPVDYSLGADSQPQPDVPKGAVSRHTLAPGKFFPGTPHNYQVYVPAQYDASRPIAFMIFLDGSGYAGNNVRVPVVLDNLIARRDVPPMIAIFLDPGIMPALSDQAQNRYERIFEYDSLTPRFSSFLIEELVPEVARTYNLSKDPNDHGIAGISTGGVGAFVAAWNRPDQFRRVITWVGSFGNFRGADRLPGLIRRTEPRPLRIFMQTGRQDLVNYAGSWYLENPRMAAALEFAGNDVKIELGEDGHSNRHGASILPDTLRWLWRDYPKPITVMEPPARRGTRAIRAARTAP